jgi:hypothetical protein
MPGAVQALLHLLVTADSQDAKKRVLRSLNVIVEAMGEQVSAPCFSATTTPTKV